MSVTYHFLDISIKLWRDPEIGVRSRSRSLKMIPFASFGKLFYSHSIWPYLVFFEIYSEILVEN